MKKNGKIRITGNYKPTLNPKMIIDEHPIPRADHLFNKMKGATIFCHLDVTDAYSHLPVDDDFAHALTLNTPTHGLIRPTRAVYGAANIPAIWQRRMEGILQGINNVLNFFDDILVHATSFEELLSALEIIFQRARTHGLRLNRTKCVFASPTVEFLGHRIDSAGIHKSDKHIEAVRDAPQPRSHEELQLFLGKANYYGAFIPDLATRERPLRELLRQDKFQWSENARKAYNDIKKLLISPQVLIPYDPSLPLILATDASQTGLGAVLSHRLGKGQERPIAYASRTLTPTEQRYPQIDKEALAITWAVQKFFLYLYARHWTLITDHKPLAQILHPEKSLPVLCISRMANYADFLANFDFSVEFRDTKSNTNADYCSRAPLPRTEEVHRLLLQGGEEEDYDAFDRFIINQLEQTPVRAELVASETKKDPELSNILKLLQSGKCLARAGYKTPQINYKIAANCLVLEHKVVIPTTLRSAVLKELHTAHLGMTKMKGLARSFVFWPGIDADIERTAKACENCTRHAHAPPQFRQHHWEYPQGPWERIHIDYAGPFAGMMLLIIVDAYSKWVEVKITPTMTSSATIRILDEIFSAYGVPITLVSDNGTNFVSEEFAKFLKESGVKYHKKTAPYHPATNGQAERNVQTVKDALKTMDTTRSSLQQNINVFLRQYRKAPHATTGQPPAVLFLGRNLRTSLDLIKPEDVTTKISEKQRASFNPTFRMFSSGQSVKFLSGNPRMDKWIPGTIVTRLGDLHYEIDFFGKQFKRHIDQIRSCELSDRSDSLAPKYTSRHSSEVQGSVTVQPRYVHQNLAPRNVSPETSTRENMSTVIGPSGQVEPVSETEAETSQAATPTAPGVVRSPQAPKLQAGQSVTTPRRSSRPRKPRVIFSPE